MLVRGRGLSLLEREEISRGIAAGLSGRVIAAGLGRDHGVVNREIARCGGRAGYRAHTAEWLAQARRARPKQRKVEACSRLLEAVNAGLAQRWSPRQISCRLAKDHPDAPELRVSHEAIYQALYCQARGALRADLKGVLRRGGTVRVSRAQRAAITAKREAIPDKIMISQRPAEAEDRAVPGHWEGDLIMGAGNRSAIITLVERSTRFVILQRVPYDHNADRVALLLTQAMGRLPQLLRRSLTWDQGREMTRHARFTIATGIPVFFADPHSPWQRGSNENTNGLLREFFPKGTDLSIHSQTDLDNVAYLLNGRPRQTLDFDTPAEVLDRMLTEAGEALTG
ncbi:putative transposase [Mobilicoccus pelagius NBRC 104925]|uniref:Putative transposase n=1 Tax=Mobilicoccus pelagius NBRC 104925 TaxID=1089455 RepID=H5USA3_9MICO|nr:IS30 family transposase [Mobilicoccus pelagius]GAB48611.1 putative transposase [Mobilicoccus pelagius NBRC 104925]